MVISQWLHIDHTTSRRSVKQLRSNCHSSPEILARQDEDRRGEVDGEDAADLRAQPRQGPRPRGGWGGRQGCRRHGRARTGKDLTFVMGK